MLTSALTMGGVNQTQVRHFFGTTSWETATPPLHGRILCVSKSSKAHLECCGKRDLMMQASVQV